MSQIDDANTKIADDESRAEPPHTDAIAMPPPDLPIASDVTSSAGDDAETTDAVVLLEDSDGYRRRWETIQSAFVDEPRRAVEQADALVAEVIRTLADSFSNEQQRLEGQWSSGDNVSTDDLRIALQRYRSFFQRLLTS